MSTTFAVEIKTNDYCEHCNRGIKLVKIAYRSNGIRFINDLAEKLPSETEVIPTDNTHQGICTIGDIKRKIKEQNKI